MSRRIRNAWLCLRYGYSVNQTRLSEKRREFDYWRTQLTEPERRTSDLVS